MSRFIGSLSLSSSLLEALPPMFLAKLAASSGPRVSIACVVASFTSRSSPFSAINVA